jgi:hypothetical protein
MRILLLFILLASCGPASMLPSLEEEQTLYDKKPAEIMFIKYNNDVTLDCSIALDGRVVNSFIWRLAEGHSQTQLLDFYLGRNNLTVVFQVEKLEFPERVTVETHDGKAWDMEHSPTLELSFKRVTREQALRGEGTSRSIKLYENISTLLYTRQSEHLGRQVQEQLSCIIRTKARTAYRQQQGQLN